MAYRYGYPTSSTQFFGQTAARKGFVQDSNKNLAGSSFDTSMHLKLNADHSQMVSRSNYQNYNAYRASISANVLQDQMPTGTAEALTANAKLPSLLETPGRFQPAWPARLNPPATPREFIKKWATSPKLVGNGCCPVEGCKHVSFYQADLVKHIKEAHSSNQKTTKAIRLSCSKDFLLSSYPLNHITGPRRCKGNINVNLMIYEVSRQGKFDYYGDPPEAVWVTKCDKPNCTYWTFKESIENHECDNVKPVTVRRKRKAPLCNTEKPSRVKKRKTAP